MIKRSIPFLILFVVFLQSCGETAEVVKVDKKPELVFENPYWRKIVAGEQDGRNSAILILPYSNPVEDYKVDSVYFLGYHEELRPSVMDEKDVYRVQIMLIEGHQPITPPIALGEYEALVSYMNADDRKEYIKVKDIQQLETVHMP